MNILCLLLLFAANSPFEFRAAGPDSLELIDRGKPVFVYNYGMMLPSGVPEKFRRSSYLHPVYSPAGVLLTDDFPKDHLHHRGIFWAWRQVTYAGRTHDLWTIEGVHHRFIRFLRREAGPDSARLAVENGWFTAERQIVKETVEIVANPVAGGRRALDFTLTFEAIAGPVEISGSPDRGYSGFGFRFAPRTNTILQSDAGREKEDTNLVPHRWAELTADFAGRHGGARIDIDPANPGAPNGWCLRHYGYLGVDFPGFERYTLKPGTPLRLKYRVTLY